MRQSERTYPHSLAGGENVKEKSCTTLLGSLEGCIGGEITVTDSDISFSCHYIIFSMSSLYLSANET